MSRPSFVLSLAAALMLACGLQSQPSFGAPPTGPSASKMHAAVRAGKWIDAQKQAEALLETGGPSTKLQAAMVLGRVLLALEKDDAAAQLVAKLDALKLPQETGQQQVEVYKAWLKARKGRKNEAVADLRKMLERGLPVESTADAADVLAMIHLEAGEKKQAQAAVDFGLRLIKFHELDTKYAESLLKGRMRQPVKEPDTSAEALALYQKGEEQRRAEKFPNAAKFYKEVREKFPKSEWAHASGFRLGQCLLGIDNVEGARELWLDFIEQDAHGPWRGQAHVALYDVALDREYDLPAARERIALAMSGLEAAHEDLAYESWANAGRGLHLRAGTLAYADGNFAAAAKHLEEYRKSATSAPTRAFRQLVEEAKAGQPLVPEEIGDRTGTEPLVVGLGLVRALTSVGLPERALKLHLTHVAGGNLVKTPSEKAFAYYARGRALHALRDLTNATKSYQSAFAAQRGADWHDETLYHLAMAVEQEGLQAPGAAPNYTLPGTGRPKPKRPPNRSSPAAQRRADSLKRDRIAKARVAATSHWSELLERFPKSRYVEAALYHVGTAAFMGEQWEQSAAAYQKLVDGYPKSRWVGTARVGLVDAHLERLFDLPEARQQSDAAVAWMDQTLANRPKEDADPYELSTARGETQPARALSIDAFEIYFRAGLVAYLESDYATAVALFQKAKPHQPSRTFTVVVGKIPTGLERLVATSKSGESLTPTAALEDGDDQTNLILQLADLYHDGKQHERCEELCDRLLAGRGIALTKTARSYTHFRRGRNHYTGENDDFDPKAALADYLAAEKTDSKAEWSDNCLFLAANIHWNHGSKKTEGDKKAAADKAILLWNKLAKQYPESEEADRAAYFVGSAYEWSNRLKEAKRSYQKTLEDYPDSDFAHLVAKHLAEVEKALQAER